MSLLPPQFGSPCHRLAWCLGLLMAGVIGCRQSGAPTTAGGPFQFGTAPQLANQPPVGAVGSGLAQQNNAIQQRLSAFDTDNQLLNTEIASLQQQLQLANQYNQSLRQQLADTAARAQQAQQQVAQLQQAAASSANTAQSAPAAQSARFQNAGATLRANNSLMQKLGTIQIAGAQARMDGDVIRIEFPSDGMFVSGSYDIQPARLPDMQQLVATIAQQFPRQIVGIEGHWDQTSLANTGLTPHQLTSNQALAVFDRLVSLGLPANQLFTMALGNNRPRYSPAAPAPASNRRIELVIYPETYDRPAP